MKKCLKCNVNIDSNRKICPLCFEKLQEVNEIEDEVVYPHYEMIDKKRNLYNRIIGFIALTFILVSILINFLTRKSNPAYWSLYVVSGSLYLWLLLRWTFSSTGNTARKLVTQVILISFITWVIDRVSNSTGWSLNYVAPFLTISSTLSIFIILLIRKIKYSDYLLFLFASVLLGFVPTVLYLTKLSTILWPSIAATVFSFLVILAMIFFVDREAKTELVKRFHI